MIEKSSKLTFAQSSDIRSRTYMQYRYDMKKKGIAELEFVEYLRDVLVHKHGDATITVEKSGGDSKLWFLRGGGKLTGTPDFLAKQLGKKLRYYEFQYAESSSKLKFFDFKVSKIGRKKSSIREPYTDREFFYVIKDENKYSFFTPKWVMENGSEGFIAAWRSQGYRVSREKFLSIFKDGRSELQRVIQKIDDKLYLLEFQTQFLAKEEERLANRLRSVVDEKVVFKIIPRTLTGIYEVCYLMDKLNKQPDVPSIWLVYLATLLRDDLPSIEFAKFMFAFDFVYFKCDDLQDNEKQIVEHVAKNATSFIEQRVSTQNGRISVDPHESEIEGTAHIVFALNLLEDIVQDAVVTFDVSLPSVNKIFQTLPNVISTANFIRNALAYKP